MRAHDCEIIEMVGTLASRTGYDGKLQTLDLNLIRRNGRPLYDLRWWADGTPMHGVSLTERTLAELGELIEKVFEVKGKNEEQILHL